MLGSKGVMMGKSQTYNINIVEVFIKTPLPLHTHTHIGKQYYSSDPPPLPLKKIKTILDPRMCQEKGITCHVVVCREGSSSKRTSKSYSNFPFKVNVILFNYTMNYVKNLRNKVNILV